MYGELKIEFFAELVNLNGAEFEVKHKMNCKITGLMSPEMVGAIAASIKNCFDRDIQENIAQAFTQQ